MTASLTRISTSRFLPVFPPHSSLLLPSCYGLRSRCNAERNFVTGHDDDRGRPWRFDPVHFASPQEGRDAAKAFDKLVPWQLA